MSAHNSFWPFKLSPEVNDVMITKDKNAIAIAFV